MINRLLIALLFLTGGASAFAADPDATLRVASYEKALKFAQDLTQLVHSPAMAQMLPMFLAQYIKAAPDNPDFKGLDMTKPIYLRMRFPRQLAQPGTGPGDKGEGAAYFPVKDFKLFLSGFLPESFLKSDATALEAGGYGVFFDKAGSGNAEQYTAWSKLPDPQGAAGVASFHVAGAYVDELIDMATQGLAALKLLAAMQAGKLGGAGQVQAQLAAMDGFSNLLQSGRGGVDPVVVSLEDSPQSVALVLRAAPRQGSTFAKRFSATGKPVLNLKGLYAGTADIELLGNIDLSAETVQWLSGMNREVYKDILSPKANEDFAQCTTHMLASLQPASLYAAWTLSPQAQWMYILHRPGFKADDFVAEMEKMAAILSAPPEVGKSPLYKSYKFQKNSGKIDATPLHRVSMEINLDNPLYQQHGQQDFMKLMALDKMEVLFAASGDYLIFSNNGEDRMREILGRIGRGELAGSQRLERGDLKFTMNVGKVVQTLTKASPVPLPPEYAMAFNALAAGKIYLTCYAGMIKEPLAAVEFSKPGLASLGAAVQSMMLMGMQGGMGAQAPLPVAPDEQAPAQ